ncbi:MAG: HAMP domain-containing sensor histidine kinase [Brachybacterium sp.]|nr:HAMP domain-containing sensor histidine kinase [Brachybacterium sp.]
MTPRVGATAASAPRRTRGFTVRGRVLVTMLVFMAVGLAVTGFVAFFAQMGEVEARHAAEVEQEIAELLATADARDANGDIRHRDVDSLLREATESAVPSDHESFLALIDGDPAYTPRRQDFELVELGHLPRIQDAAESAEGQVVYLRWDEGNRDLMVAVTPVQVLDDPAEGAFIVATDLAPEKRVVWRNALNFAAVSLVVLLIAWIAGNAVTRRLFQPVADLREATESVTVRDLSRRVSVPDSSDDISAMARNFNTMLDRLETGVDEQRRFTSDVGHELRTPITIVQGTLEMTDIEDPGDVRESHAIALDELQRMNRVVGDLSELARSGRPDYVVPEPVDMEEFARDAFARVSKVGERHWVLERSAPAIVDADQQRLMQAVVQLAANAVRYSDEGSRISLTVDRVLGPDGPEIHIGVTDEGIGIRRADQTRIFHRFQRVESEDASPRGGAGLGLAIVAAIMQAHGGEVRLDSRLGHGSTFTLVIPQTPRGETLLEPTPDPSPIGETRP